MSPNPRTIARKPMTAQPPPARGRVFIRIERCKGCEFCVEFCPQKVLALSTEFNPKGFHYPVVVKDVCINCNLCVSLCPDYAIFSRPAGTSRAAHRTPQTIGDDEPRGTSSRGPKP
jgi:2-oxoglutarate ferredoxin oxidoreductase subunit delta